MTYKIHGYDSSYSSDDELFTTETYPLTYKQYILNNERLTNRIKINEKYKTSNDIISLTQVFDMFNNISDYDLLLFFNEFTKNEIIIIFNDLNKFGLQTLIYKEKTLYDILKNIQLKKLSQSHYHEIDDCLCNCVII